MTNDNDRAGPGPTAAGLEPGPHQVSSSNGAVAASAPVATPSIVQVEAAKLRLVTDRRLGKQSPAWLQRVAQGLPPQGAAATG